MHKTSRGTLPHSVSTFIRREKARIRRVAWSREEAEKKIAELFTQAFQFIDSPVYWKAIERLAYYILNNTKNTISCEEAIAVLDESTILPLFVMETERERSDKERLDTIFAFSKQ